MFEVQDPTYVQTPMCEKTHEDLKELCMEKHKAIGDKLDSNGAWLKGLVGAIIVEIMVMATYMIVNGHAKI